MCLQICGYAFWTQAALVHGKVVPRLDPYYMIFFDKQIHPALHSAIWAMCRNHLVDVTLGAPTTEWLVVKMRAKAVNDASKVLNF